MRIACWTPKATDTYSEYVILIAFLLQQWLRERSSMLFYTHIACVVYTTHVSVSGVTSVTSVTSVKSLIF